MKKRVVPMSAIGYGIEWPSANALIKGDILEIPTSSVIQMSNFSNQTCLNIVSHGQEFVDVQLWSPPLQIPNNQNSYSTYPETSGFSNLPQESEVQLWSPPLIPNNQNSYSTYPETSGFSNLGSHGQLRTAPLMPPPGPAISPMDNAPTDLKPTMGAPSQGESKKKSRSRTSKNRAKLLEHIFKEFNISSGPSSKKRSQPFKIPEKVTTCAIPSFCYEEMVPTPLYGGKLIKREDGEIFKESISMLNTENRATPMIDCIRGVGFNNPQERLFGSWAEKKNTHFRFVIMWPGYPEPKSLIKSIPIHGIDGLVTRLELGQRIGIEYEKFVTVLEKNQFPCQEPRWRVGLGRYTLDRIRLHSLYWVKEDIWQAYVSVLTDKHVDPNCLNPMVDLLMGQRL